MKFQKEILPFCKELRFPYLNNQFVLNNEHIGKPIPIPLPVIGDKIYAPNRYVKGLLFYYQNHCHHVEQRVYIPPPFNIFLNFHWLDILANELKTWMKHYKPPSENMTILDAGAGCGETAWLFLKHFKAKKVICIEPNIERASLIALNAQVNDWPIELITEPLNKYHLTVLEYDFAKIDIEGAEINFLHPFSNLKVPCVIETHRRDVTHLFNLYGFSTVWNNHRGVCLIRND